MPLDWVQEKKEEDPDFGVILAAPLKKGETTTLKISYAGKDVVLSEGGDNYYPIARENWYPSSNQGLGDYATYYMHFHVPKELQLIATGTKINEVTEGKITTTEWKTETPLPVVGFSLGAFEAERSQDRLPIGRTANRRWLCQQKTAGDLQLPRAISFNNAPTGYIALQNVGNIDTLRMLPVQLNQAQVAAQIYTQYFGQLPFSHVAITQQFPCDYGQSWPMLVYLPTCGFLDPTQQHFFGLGEENLNEHMYWKVVTPHEVAHQWWGQTVGFRSYRDQWMSEGFANTSASIFLQFTRPKPDDFRSFWSEERRLLTEKNQFGFRPIDVGPVTMGIRLSSPKVGWDIYGDLVYPKGAYILHMIRMMMWSPKDGDALFKATMQDFVNTYRLQAATTEDFKAIVEKHMSPGMYLDGNHTMDWFFNEYVYGTDLPAYHFEGDATPSGNGWTLHFKLTQSGVGANFKNLVPLYLELAGGNVIRLGKIAIEGPNTVERTVQLPATPAPIKKVSINYFYDVLCTDN